VNVCGKCEGTGEIGEDVCTTCSGSGKIEVKNKVFNIHVKKGLRDGSVITQQNVGRNGLNGGPRGDVHVKLNMVLPDPDVLTEEQRKVLDEL
jgi:molecular chaperone DnaJ